MSAGQKGVTTMAILNGIISKLSGSAGQLSFRQRNGVTVVSEKMTSQTNPRTPSQMATRTKFTNIGAMFRGIRPLLNDGFENKKGQQTDIFLGWLQLRYRFY